jgi:hypothetical protein
VRGGGHLFLLERPARIAAVVADFLKAEDVDGADRVAGQPGWTSPTDSPPRGR